MLCYVTTDIFRVSMWKCPNGWIHAALSLSHPSCDASFQASSVCISLNLCSMTSIDPCAPIHPAPSSTQTGSLSSSGVSEGAHCQVVFEKRWNGQGHLQRIISYIFTFLFIFKGPAISSDWNLNSCILYGNLDVFGQNKGTYIYIYIWHISVPCTWTQQACDVTLVHFAREGTHFLPAAIKWDVRRAGEVHWRCRSTLLNLHCAH